MTLRETLEEIVRLTQALYDPDTGAPLEGEALAAALARLNAALAAARENPQCE